LHPFPGSPKNDVLKKEATELLPEAKQNDKDQSLVGKPQ
jgi:hypothetical protein